MQKVSLQQAVKMTGRSESTLRRDVKKGKTSAERDDRGHLKFDPAELRRVYGELKSPGEDAQSTENSNDQAMTGHDRGARNRRTGEPGRGSQDAIRENGSTT